MRKKEIEEGFIFALVGVLGTPTLLHQTCNGGRVVIRRRRVNCNGGWESRWFCEGCHRFLVKSTKPIVLTRKVRKKL